MQKNSCYVFSEPIQFRVTSRICIDIIIRKVSIGASRDKNVRVATKRRDLTKRHDSTKKVRLNKKSATQQKNARLDKKARLKI